jgi:hypothetical protein
MFRPWLSQAPAGSYQFAIRVEEPRQGQFWEQANKPKIEHITTTFFRVLRASANDPEGELLQVVPNKEYRDAFLNLSRSLAPTPRGKFDRLEVRDASSPNDPVASFAIETRQRLNNALQKSKPSDAGKGEPVILRGILRALHLDKDWLEIVLTGTATSIRIDKAGEALDDVIGPMVNRPVAVMALRRGTKYLYRDIEPDD